jgi:hypothetical protein
MPKRSRNIFFRQTNHKLPRRPCVCAMDIWREHVYFHPLIDERLFEWKSFLFLILQQTYTRWRDMCNMKMCGKRQENYFKIATHAVQSFSSWNANKKSVCVHVRRKLDDMLWSVRDVSCEMWKKNKMLEIHTIVVFAFAREMKNILW